MTKAATKKKAEPVELPEPELSKLQNFTVERIHRSQLKNAEYNPRQITDAAMRKLRTGMKKHGIVSPPTWNKRTGNIVGGHQRLKVLDLLAGTENYLLDVAVIDVDEDTEKQQNVLLNNPEAQGDWDIDKLGLLVKVPNIDLGGMGFDMADVFHIFGDGALTSSAELDEFANKIRSAQEMYVKAQRKGGEVETNYFYMVLVFRNDADVTAFQKKYNLPENRFQSGEELDRIIERERHSGSDPAR